MCYAKPGPRCSYHVTQQMEKLQENIAETKRDIAVNDDPKKAEALQDKLNRLNSALSDTRKAFYTTPAGQKDLEKKIESARNHNRPELAQRLSNLKLRSSEIRQEQMTAYTAAKHAQERGYSPSRMNDYTQCPLQYRLTNIDKLPEPQGPEAFRGTQVHKVLEDTFYLPKEQRTLENAHKMIEKEFAEHANEEAAKSVSPEEYKQWENDAKDLVTSWFQMEDPQKLSPHNQERRIDLHHQGMNLRGFIDRVDRTDDGKYRIVDYKTGHSPQESYQDKYLFQMKFYAFAMWKSTGNMPKRMQLVFLKDQQNIAIEPTERDLDNFGKKLSIIHSSMENARKTGDFPPRKSKLCDFCHFKDKCPEFGGTTPPYPQQ